jgi:hydrogenase maturation protease
VKPVLIAGIGNIFHGDDGFGVCVAQRMAQASMSEQIEVVDFGIRGLDLAYALTGGYGLAILIDTVQRGGAAGTVYVIEPENLEEEAAGISPHQVDPASVLRLVRTIGGECACIRLVGCEPASFGDEADGRMGLSDEVAGAVDLAAATATAIALSWLRERALPTGRRADG